MEKTGVEKEYAKKPSQQKKVGAKSFRNGSTVSDHGSHWFFGGWIPFSGRFGSTKSRKSQVCGVEYQKQRPGNGKWTIFRRCISY